MGSLKRWFPLGWLVLLIIAVGHSSVELVANGLSYSWLAALMGCGAVIAVLGVVAISDMARTSENLPLLHTLTAAAPTLILFDLAGGNAVGLWPLLYAVVLAYGGTLLYLRWYPGFGRTPSRQIQPGAVLPEFMLQSVTGEALSRDQLLNGKPTVLMFIRGNWCPLCVAQVKELVSEYQALADMGAQVFVVSSQPADKTAKLAQRFNVPIGFLTDSDNSAAKALGILNEAGAPAGVEVLGYDSDVPYPTTVITNGSGRILYSSQTDNYRVRPEPAEFIQVLEAAKP